MQVYNYIMLVYFLVLVVLVNWKGNAFLRLSIGPRTAVALGLFMPLVAWVVIHRVVD